MVKIGSIADRRIDPRIAYPKRIHARAKEAEAEGQVQDISTSGVALLTGTHLDNNTFVQLHIDGIGPMKGRVTRTYPKGFAVQFDADEEQQERLEKAIAEHREAAGIKSDQGTTA